jgi:hypothetical protein
MASGIRVLSIARKSYRTILQHHFFFRNHTNSSSNSNPLLLKLHQLPNSNIKTTLDHEFPSLPTSLISFHFLVTSLSPSSQKPNLVITILSSSPHSTLFLFIWTAIHSCFIWIKIWALWVLGIRVNIFISCLQYSSNCQGCDSYPIMTWKSG